MFNKSNLFPKTAESAAGRNARPLGTTSASGVSGPVSAGGHATASAQGMSSSLSSAPDTAATPGKPSPLPAGSAIDVADAAVGDSRLIVGPDVKLKGAEILDCDTLVVEGRVEATMDSRVIRIAEAGAFSGKVGIDIAEIHGVFEGELTARQQLRIHSTGRVSGKIRYGRILIEEGGEVSGDVQPLAAAGKEAGKPYEKSIPEMKPLAAVSG